MPYKLSSVPELSKSAIAAVQVVEALREDSEWLDTVAAVDEDGDDVVDPHVQAIWEQAPEGREAIGVANKRVREGLRPRHVREAGWGD